MKPDSRPLSLPSRMRASTLAFGLGLLLAGGSAFGAAGSGTPAKVVPQPRWNSSSSLQPGPILGDSTHFVGHSDPRNGDTLEYHGVDIENGMLFAATGQGLQIFDVKGQTPTLKSYIWGYFTSGAFPGWEHLGDKDWFLKYIDAPEGNSSLVALGMEEQGFAIVRTSDPLLPVVAYQAKLPSTEVYSFTSGGQAQAYAIVMNGGAISRFNMSAAASMNKCLETPPAGSCSGVYKGTVASLGTSNSAIHGAGNFLATGRSVRSAGTYQGFLKLWNISDPANPTLIADLGVPALAVGMWQSGSSYYVARIDQTKKLSIYNVSCMASGSCTNVPEIWSATLTSPSTLSHLSVSKDGGKHYLYVGGDDLSSCVPQREYIYDLTSPNAPEELTPKNDPAGYWGWYYMSCDTGFNLVGPRAGKVSGGVLYRAAMSVLDSHKIGNSGPPVANFTVGPKAPDTEIYAGAPIQFTDASSGQITSWSWTFQGGTPPTATGTRAPVVTFDTAGSKTVGLVVGNGAGLQSSPFSQQVTVLDPAPTLGGVTVTPASPTVCQPVTLKALNAKGRSVLQYDFKVEDGNGTPVPGAGAAGTSDSYVWNTGAGTAPGNYTAKLTLSNTAGSVTQTKAFTLGALSTLPLPGQFTPTNDTFTAGTVQLHVNVPGATEWSWDFDDDANPATTSWTAWSNDPVAGPNPSHSYTSKGVRTVRVRVRNCTTAETGVQSGDLSFNITVITPLKAAFLLNTQCTGGTCFVTAGQAVGIVDASTGAERWDYDWDANGSYEDADNAAPRTTHTFPTPGTFAVKLRVRRGSNEEAFDTKTVKVDPAGPPPVGSISIGGPSSGQPGAALSFTATGSGSCNPNAAGWNWTADGGTITGTGNQVTISWASQGNKTVSVTNTACSGVTGSKSVTIGGGTGGGGTLKADFSFSPTAPNQGQAVSFNGSASTGSPTGYVWDFGDGTPFGSGVQTTHTYAKAGTYRVQLSVTKPGSCAPAPFCEAAVSKTVVVGTGEAPLGAAFQTSATCISEFGLNVCSAAAGQTVTFTDATTGGPTGWSWNFGDGETATGSSVSHVFKKKGTYTVTLTATRGSVSGTASRTFNVSGDDPKPVSNTVVLPWIAQSRGVLNQSSDLYVHNPGTTAMEIVLEFRKRGLPEVNPPKATRTIAPGATLYVADVLKELFNWENIVGFVTITRTKGDAQPVMTSFNTTFGADGSQFGQTIPGVSLSVEAASATTGSRVQYLVGLNDNGDREAYFGVTNPNSEPATYRLKFYDSLGRPIGTSSTDLRLSAYGLKQFQPAEVRSQFGINTQDDYRVEVETVSGGQLFPYGANVRTTSDDPSFLGVGLSSKSKLYLIGALSSPGINNTKWQTDLVVANTGTGVALTDVTFTRAGLTSQPTTPVKLTLQAGETQRLENIVSTKWSINDAVGVLTIESDSPNSVFPIVQGESYETTNTNAGMRFGQFMAAFTDEDAAGAGKAHYLVGLRQDANSRTTFWLYNPSNEPGNYDLIYRALDGTELGRIANASLGAGKLRQLSPSQHPLPGGVTSGGFTVQVVVKSGKVISAAQVINNKTNDPAYVQGQAQK